MTAILTAVRHRRLIDAKDIPELSRIEPVTRTANRVMVEERQNGGEAPGGAPKSASPSSACFDH